MARKNPRPAAKKRLKKLRLATKNGNPTPSYYRTQNPGKSDMALAMGYLFAARPRTREK